MAASRIPALRRRKTDQRATASAYARHPLQIGVANRQTHSQERDKSKLTCQKSQVTGGRDDIGRCSRTTPTTTVQRELHRLFSKCGFVDFIASHDPLTPV